LISALNRVIAGPRGKEDLSAALCRVIGGTEPAPIERKSPNERKPFSFGLFRNRGMLTYRAIKSG